MNNDADDLDAKEEIEAFVELPQILDSLSHRRQFVKEWMNTIIPNACTQQNLDRVIARLDETEVYTPDYFTVLLVAVDLGLYSLR